MVKTTRKGFEVLSKGEGQVWGYGPQDMGRTIRGGPAHKIKACMVLFGVHRKTLYNTKYDTLLVTLPLQSI